MAVSAPTPALPADVAKFRAERRAELIPGPPYAGWMHFAWTTLGCSAIIVGCALGLQAVTWLEWLTVPGLFLFANLVEWRLHNKLLHHRVRFAPLLYERHTLWHHHFYTADAMAAETGRDWYMVLFPPWALLLLALGLAPIAAGLGWAVSANVGLLFLATGVGYFLSYEWLHLSYHLDPDGVIGRNPVVAVLREHHRRHHDKRLMTKWNFNVTWPIFDYVFGTVWRGE